MASSLSVVCGQMLVVGLAGPTLLTNEQRGLAAGERGGVVLFRRNIRSAPARPAGDASAAFAETRALTSAVTAAMQTALPDAAPIIAVDQEGGRVMRLGAPALQLPPMRRLGDLGDEAFIARVAEAQARELLALGFTLSFAPVADVHTRDENPIIGDRAFATTPAQVARFAGAFAAGLQRGGIRSCAKHFPGHGDTTVDSHLALPRVDRDAAGLAALEIASFRALARHPAIDSMMTAHVVYPALDPAQPATLSRAICTDLLRGELGFTGVLFSDDLEMKALTMPVAESAVRAVLAGCDALLVCSQADLAAAAHEALVHEAERSAVFRARCEQASRRILAMRRGPAGAGVFRSNTELAQVLAASAPIALELRERLGTS